MSASAILNCAGRTMVLDRPMIMGILNVTPDSFSDGGRFAHLDTALRHSEQMLSDGADFIDVGGESTRPGAADVSEQREMDRVLPVIEAIASRFDTVISIDTSKATVMSAAAAAGAGMINDVRALQEPGALEAAAISKLPVCLMHMQGQPRTMQKDPYYKDVTQEVGDFLSERLEVCVSAGIQRCQVVIDPGFGFGKNYNHNWELVDKLNSLTELAPVLTGLSRKRMIAESLGSADTDRTVASAAAALLCVINGASIVRVHDVAPTAHALATVKSMMASRTMN